MNRLQQYFEKIQFNKDITFDKGELPILPLGFKPTVLGEPLWGMLGQYRYGLLHAYDFGSYWLIHKDRYNPETHPLQHLLVDAPKWLAFAGFIGGIAAGSILISRLDKRATEKHSL